MSHIVDCKYYSLFTFSLHYDRLARVDDYLIYLSGPLCGPHPIAMDAFPMMQVRLRWDVPEKLDFFASIKDILDNKAQYYMNRLATL